MVVIDRSEHFCTPVMVSGKAQAADIQGRVSRIVRSPGFGHGSRARVRTFHRARDRTCIPASAGHKNSIVTRRLFPYNQDKRSMARIIE